MKYGIQARMIGSTSWVVDSGDKFELTLDPSRATTWDTKKEAIQWGKTNIARFDNEIPYVVTKITVGTIRDFMTWREDGYIVGSESKRTPYRYDAKKHGVDDVIDFYIWHRNNEFRISYDDYSSWPSIYGLQKLKYIRDVKFYIDADHTFQFWFRKDVDHDVETFKAEIEYALSFEPNVKNLEGGYIFDVFDHYLSEFGNSVKFVYYDDNYCIVSGRWNNEVEGTIEECFDFLVRERYYD